MFLRRQRSSASDATAATVTPSATTAGPTSALDADAQRDTELLATAKRGEIASFNALVTRHERAVFNVCLRMLRDVEAAEDATQDTFIKAWSALDTYRGGLVRAWLLRIATNRCYDLLRVKQRRPADSLDASAIETTPDWSSQIATDDDDPEVASLRGELGRRLESALASLPDDQRLIVILADVQGYSYEEVAAIADIAVGTVKSRLSRARSRLRDLLRADPAGQELFAQYGRLSDE